VNASFFRKFREWIASPVESAVQDPGQPSYERLAIPHSFKPQLSVSQAVIAAGGALLRIILGSLLFAIWGTYSFLVWSTIPNLFLRFLLLLVMLALFAFLMALMLVGISALLRMIWPHRAPRA
jgi:hypothetical protein